MNVIWVVMILAGYTACIFTNPNAALSAMTEAGSMSVSLTLNLLAVNCIWLGVMAIAEKTGLNAALSRLLRPVIRFLFKGTSPETDNYIAVNMSANLLGMGGAATPMGIAAMKSMDDKSGRATDNMLMLVILNATSLQLFPSTIISLRAAAGSKTPADIIIPSLTASLLNTLLGVAIVKILNKRKARRPVNTAPRKAGNV